MNDFTPPTGLVRWTYAAPDGRWRPEFADEFDRWLRDTLARAWDEGAEAGYDDAEAGREEKHNPYREENR